MTELTREQLAEIRTRDGKYSDEFMPEMVADRHALLAHIDHQAAKLAELCGILCEVRAYIDQSNMPRGHYKNLRRVLDGERADNLNAILEGDKA